MKKLPEVFEAMECNKEPCKLASLRTSVSKAELRQTFLMLQRETSLQDIEHRKSLLTTRQLRRNNAFFIETSFNAAHTN
jgi:hypothetical protein